MTDRSILTSINHVFARRNGNLKRGMVRMNKRTSFAAGTALIYAIVVSTIILTWP